MLASTVVLGIAAQAGAQQPAADSAGPVLRDTTAIVPAPDSPRAALTAFLELTRAGRIGDAAVYLDLPDSLRGRGPELARALKAILDRYLWFDLDAISPASAGDTTDGLPRGVEQVGAIPGPGWTREPVRLARNAPGREPAWRFSRGTVARIPAWFGRLEGRWAITHLPAPLLRPGPLELLWWQWLALPVIAGAAWLLGALAAHLARALLGRLARRTSATWDDVILERLGGPLTLGGSLLAALLLLPWLALYAPAHAAVARLLRAGGFLFVFWTLWRLVDVARELVTTAPWGLRSAGVRALLPILGRAAKIAVLAIAAATVLSELGFSVAGVITGLGLGGLAFALAAQKTVENLFGAVSIGVDQPFREGDFVKIEDFVGTVEAIGLRSTRIRTLDRTIITMPNGKLADMRVESFTARDRLRLATVIGLTYGTTARQMREVLAGLEAVLRAHPKIWPDAVVVRFSAFAASSLDIEIMAWFQTTDWGEFQLIRQEILLQFMEVVERAGASFAFPTRTVHLIPAGTS